MAIPPYPHPTPTGPRPQIKSISAGSFSGAGQDISAAIVISVETCEDAPSVQLDGADIPVAPEDIKIVENRGSIATVIPLIGLDPGVHLITVTDANDTSDAVQIFVSV
jgi:hypothetical protein